MTAPDRPPPLASLASAAPLHAPAGRTAAPAGVPDAPDATGPTGASADVPLRWRGVWQRRVLAAPGVYDTTTAVRWLQTATQHADLRLPAGSACASGEDAWRQQAAQQGFFGRTERRVVGDREQCWWHREHDFQPPPEAPDAGWMAFDGADLLIETGVHADYLEVWQRLPGSTGRHAVLARGPHDAERLLLAGDHLAWVRARPLALPPALPGTSLIERLQTASAAQRAAALDMPLVFGRWDGRTWHIEHANLPAWAGQRLPLQCSLDGAQARVASPVLPADWRRVEGAL